MPPNKFSPAEGVLWAKILDEQPTFIRRRRVRGAKARGVSYERKAHEYLRERLLGLPAIDYVESPWVEFKDTSGVRWCQPDAFILNRAAKFLSVVEVKYKHTSDAWWQLWRLYRPVARVLFPDFVIGTLEICKWFDPAVRFPAQVVLTHDPLVIPSASETAVHVFNPQRR